MHTEKWIKNDWRCFPTPEETPLVCREGSTCVWARLLQALLHKKLHHEETWSFPSQKTKPFIQAKVHLYAGVTWLFWSPWHPRLRDQWRSRSQSTVLSLSSPLKTKPCNKAAFIFRLRNEYKERKKYSWLSVLFILQFELKSSSSAFRSSPTTKGNVQLFCSVSCQ